MVVSADPVDLLMRLSGAQCVSRALHVVAELGIADALDDTPQSTFLEKRGRIDEHTFSENDMSIRATDLYEFGPYRLNPERRLFTRGQFVVPLAPKTFELLLLMVQHPGRAFSKQN